WYWARTRDKASHDPMPIPQRLHPQRFIHFSDCILNFVKHVRFTSPDRMPIDKELYAVQAWKIQAKDIKHFGC
ncbi:hypothetical protein TNCV_3172561, partial [Trichonephila clavipes]